MVQKSLGTSAKSAFSIAGLLATVLAGTGAWALPYEDADLRPAVYSVPVSAALEPYANYPIREIGFRVESGQVFIGYHLPAELTGLATSEIILKGEVGTGASYEVKGTGGAVGVCQRSSERKISCRIEYGLLEFNAVTRRQLLQDEFKDPRELAARTEVAHAFASEPIGILSFEE